MSPCLSYDYFGIILLISNSTPVQNLVSEQRYSLFQKKTKRGGQEREKKVIGGTFPT